MATGVKLCQNFINWKFFTQQLENIISDINNFAVDVNTVLRPKTEDIFFSKISSDIYFEIEDILEMDSLSSAEKEQEIRQMVEDNKDALQNLARQVIAKLEADFEQTKIDLKEQVKEMEEKGYEQDTIDRFVKTILGTEGFKSKYDK